MKMKMYSLLLGALIALTGLAATETHSVQFPLDYTDWSKTAVFPQFNSANGTLNSATISIYATGVTQTGIENHDPSPRVAVTGSDIKVTISGISTNSVGSTITNSLAAFDGSDDFSGPSGAINPPATVSDSQYSALVPASVTGTGSYSFSVHSEANSYFNGPSDYSLFVLSQSSAVIVVTYDFTPDCPEPKPTCTPNPVCEPKPFYCLPKPTGYGCRKP